MKKKLLQRAQSLPVINLDRPIIKSHYYPPGKEVDNREKNEAKRAKIGQSSSISRVPLTKVQYSLNPTIVENNNERDSLPSGRSQGAGDSVKMPSINQNNMINNNNYDENNNTSNEILGKVSGRSKSISGDGLVHALDGTGSYSYENKFFKYEGQWKKGKKNGLGKLVFQDNSYYEGSFLEGEIEGVGTRYFAATGCKYIGQFHKGELHGKGRMIWPDGSIYEGHWVHNRREGFGVMKSVKENCLYKGQYLDNKRQGQGMMIYPKGDRYQGDWYQNMRHGDGDMRYVDGTVYEGQFEDDHFNGEGIMRHCSGLIYQGVWRNGNPTVLPTKLVIINDTGKDALEFTQGKPFDLQVKCVNDNGDIIEIDSGRELRVTAGFKYLKAKKGTALFDLIEEYEEKPMQTPFYDVLQYPLTDFLAEEEEADIEEPDQDEAADTELKTSRENSISRIAEDGDGETFVNESQKESTIAEEQSRVGEASETPAELPTDTLQLERKLSSVSIPETPMSGLTSVTPGSMAEIPLLSEKDSHPLPPPVANKRSDEGQCEWKNITLAQAPPRFPPFVVLDEEERKVRARQNKQVEAKRLNRVAHDERYARVGEYVLMVHDVTTPPFMGQTLEPAFILAKLKRPKREKKPKEVKPNIKARN